MFLNNVKFLLSERGMHQKDLSNVLNISVKTVSAILLGNRNLTLEHLISLRNFFQVNADDLLFKDLSKGGK